MLRLLRPVALAIALTVTGPACVRPGSGEVLALADRGPGGEADAAVEAPNPHAGCVPLPEITGFVSREASSLMVAGQPFRRGGTNLYYMQQSLAYAQQRDDRAALAQVRDALDTMVCMSLPVARMWAFNEMPDDESSIQPAPGIFREEGLRALDQAVAEAKARGIRLILTLTNNWPEYGGLETYARWSGKKHDDFFFDEQIQGWWKGYARHLAQRVNTFTGVAYRDEPAILAWEIGNELRCRACRGTTRYADTIAGLAQFLRQTFPRHLVADGGEGFDDRPHRYRGLSKDYPIAGKEGASFSALAEIPALDLISYHFYPADWGLDVAGDAAIWIRRHQEIAMAAGKVAYLGEYGIEYGAGPDPDMARAPVYDAWLDRLFASSGGAFGLFWQLVTPSRPSRDRHAVRWPGDTNTVSVVEKWGRAAR